MESKNDHIGFLDYDKITKKNDKLLIRRIQMLSLVFLPKKQCKNQASMACLVHRRLKSKFGNSPLPRLSDGFIQLYML